MSAPYTSMYRTSESRAATTHSHSLANAAPLNSDVRESMDFISRYCRGDRVSPSRYTVDAPKPAANLATNPWSSGTTNQYQYTVPSADSPTPRESDYRRNPGQAPQLPSWAYRGPSEGSSHTQSVSRPPAGYDMVSTPSPSLGLGSGPGGRQRAMVGAGGPSQERPSLKPWEHHSPVRQHEFPVASHSTADLSIAQPASSLHEPGARRAGQPPVKPPVSAHREDDRPAAWNPSSGKAPSGMGEVADRYQSFSEGDRTLIYIGMWLKNHFGHDPNEAKLGLETMTDEDVVNLASAFQDELIPLIHEIREKEKFSSSRHNDQALQHRPQQQQQQRTNTSFQSRHERSGTTEIIMDPPEPIQIPPKSAMTPTVNASKTQQRHQELATPQQREEPLAHQQQPPPRRPTPQQTPQERPLSPPEQPASNVPTALQPQPSAQSKMLLTPTGSVSSQQMTAKQRPVDRNAQQERVRPKVWESIAMMKKGGNLVKFGRNGNPQLRYCRVDDEESEIDGAKIECPHLTWSSDITSKRSGKIPLMKLQDVKLGAESKNFKKDKTGSVIGLRGEVVRPAMCFTLVFSERNVDLYANSQDDFDMWVDGFENIVERNRQILAQERQREKEKARAERSSVDDTR